MRKKCIIMYTEGETEHNLECVLNKHLTYVKKYVIMYMRGEL